MVWEMDYGHLFYYGLPEPVFFIMRAGIRTTPPHHPLFRPLYCLFAIENIKKDWVGWGVGILTLVILTGGCAN